MALADLDLTVLDANAALREVPGPGGRRHRRRERRRLQRARATCSSSARMHEALLAGETAHYTIEKRYRRADGTHVLGEVTVSLVRDERGRPVSLQSQIRDISEQRRTAEALDRRARYSEAAAELGRIALVAADIERARRAAGGGRRRAARRGHLPDHRGRRRGAALPRGPRRRYRPQPGRALDDARALARRAGVRDRRPAGGRGPGEQRARRLGADCSPPACAARWACRSRAATARPAWSRCSAASSAPGAHEESAFLHVVANVMGSAIERSTREEAAVHRALHDPLTGLPNRDLFADRLALTLARARRGGPLPAVLIADLDQFKLINDSLGHHAGDELLCAVAPRLAAAVRGHGHGRALRRRRVRRAVRRGGRASSRRSSWPSGWRPCSTSRSRSAARRSTSRPRSGSPTPAPTATPRACCATPTPRCTARRRAAAGAASCSTRRCARRRWRGWRSRPGCGSRSAPTSSPCTSSRWSTSRAARRWRSRR